MALPVALQLYSVRGDMEKDMPGTLRSVKEMGYDGVEFAGLFGHAPADIRAMLDEIGLTAISAHVPFVEMMANPHKVFTDYKIIGCEYVAIPYLGEASRPGGPDFDTTLENICFLGGIAREHGITLLYHNHDFEFIKLDGVYGLDVMYSAVPADLLKTQLDTCWVNVGGEDPAAYIRKYSGRTPVVHLKDFYGERSADMYELIGIEKKAPTRPAGFEYRPIGYGVQDFPAILSAVLDAGAAWVVVEQDNPFMDKKPMECAAMSRAYLRTLGW
jgi:sugar phosphate isomerase/epimerase